MTHFVKLHELIGSEVPRLHYRTVQIINYGRTLHVNWRAKIDFMKESHGRFKITCFSGTKFICDGGKAWRQRDKSMLITLYVNSPFFLIIALSKKQASKMKNRSHYNQSLIQHHTLVQKIEYKKDICFQFNRKNKYCRSPPHMWKGLVMCPSHEYQSQQGFFA